VYYFPTGVVGRLRALRIGRSAPAASTAASTATHPARAR
jgi:hypothetical protein